jgi:UDP-glucose 4-epimerase
MKIGILGRSGFIGSHLWDKLDMFERYSYPRKDLDYLFLFGSPSSNIIFDQNIDYCFEETINSFLNAVQFCRNSHIKLIYPSSATVYNKNTSYAYCKAILEDIHKAYGGDILGLRIFAGYGYEKSKGDYSSVVYQFCEAIKNDKRPIIYGDGTQTRDFVFVDDVVDNIIANRNKIGIMDIGTGVNTSFNHLVKLINKALGKNINPFYVDKPLKYVENTICKNPLKKFTPIEEGIKKVIDKI